MLRDARHQEALLADGLGASTSVQHQNVPRQLCCADNPD